ncbi:MAG: COQ9 family protein [Alphaproteobacteria bacterium]
MSGASEAPRGDDPIGVLRDTVLKAALPHIPFDGWSWAALRRGAMDAGLPAADAERAFPGGGADAIDHHNAMADRQMLGALAAAEPDGLRLRGKVALAVRLRIDGVFADRDAVRRGMALLALPQNARLAARMLYRTVDAIWRAVGDTSTDWNFYSKRALLAGVYSSTLLCWLTDDTPDRQTSWAFLDRRIAEVMALPRLTGRLDGVKGLVRRFRRARTQAHLGAGGLR